MTEPENPSNNPLIESCEDQAHTWVNTHNGLICARCKIFYPYDEPPPTYEEYEEQ